MKIKYLSMILFLFGIANLLAGCGTIRDTYQSGQRILQKDAEENCVRYGFRKDTDGFAGCVQKELNPQSK